MIEVILVFDGFEKTEFQELVSKLRQCGLQGEVCSDRRAICQAINYGELLSPKLILTDLELEPAEIASFQVRNEVDKIIFIPREYQDYRLILVDFDLEDYCNFKAGYEPVVYDFLMWRKYIHNPKGSFNEFEAEFFPPRGPDLINTPFGEDQR